MSIEMIKRLIAAGDRYGSALKALTAEVGTTNLDEISDEIAEEYLRKHGAQDLMEVGDY